MSVISGAGGGVKRKKFTASDTFTVPAGVHTLYVTGCGGGGGGGGGITQGSSDSVGGGGGGGGGAVVNYPIPVTPGDVLDVVIGAGGVGGAMSTSINGNYGTAGGDSSVGNVVMGGGGRGTKGIWSGADFDYGAAGGADNLPFTVAGGRGGRPCQYASPAQYPGDDVGNWSGGAPGARANSYDHGGSGGGASAFGNGGAGADQRSSIDAAPLTEADGYGGGGGGGCGARGAASGASGGADGRPGVVYLEWFA